MKKSLCSLLVLTALLLCMVACTSEEAATSADLSSGEETNGIPANISIGTNPSSQSAYTMGAGIADVINKANIGTTVTVEETSGFPVNVQLMMNKEIEFGFVNNLIEAQAYAATASYSVYEPGQILSVMSLSPTEMHVLVPAGSDIESIYDFAGKRVGVGQPGGISLEVADMFLSAIGYEDGDFERLEINLQNQCDYLQDGQLDALVWIGSAPLAAVTGLATTEDVRFLSIDDEAFEKVKEVLSVAEKTVIPANSYAGQTEDVQTFGLRMMIAARADISEEMVYQFTKLVMENVDTLGTVHTAMSDISPDTVTLGMTEDTPLHPGAQRYYEEIGMDVSAFSAK